MNGESHRPYSPTVKVELVTLPIENPELNPLVPHRDGDEQRTSSGRRTNFQIDDGHGGSPPGSANMVQVVINIVISFVGAGLLGVPNAFAGSGWLLGCIALLTVSALNVYAMLRLPAVQIELQKTYPEESLASYGEIGRCIMGRKGEALVQTCLAISQAGFGTAYIIFIASNVYSMVQFPRFITCAACIPGLAMLVQFRSLSSLSPFSL
jgi:proton-coupled amino acid transporter